MFVFFKDFWISILLVDKRLCMCFERALDVRYEDRESLKLAGHLSRGSLRLLAQDSECIAEVRTCMFFSCACLSRSYVNIHS